MNIKTNGEHPLTSEYYRAPISGNGATSPLLVFIPGNPGLIDYYLTYLDLLAVDYPEFSVLAISHAGFQTSGDYVRAGEVDSQTFYGVEYQIEHKTKILKQYVLSGHRELYFLAHSFGGYLTQRIVKKLLRDPELRDRVDIKFIGLVCPTIVDIAKSQSGVYFTRLFNALPLVQLAVFFVGLLQVLLPESAVRYIIRNYIIAKPALTCDKLMESWNNSVEATYKIFSSKRIVRQALLLAREELNVIHRDDALNDYFFNEFAEEHDIKIWCFFAIKDYWVHDHTRDYLLARYHDVENEHVSFEVGDTDSEGQRAITHSFCIDQSVEFAAITSRAMRCAR